MHKKYLEKILQYHWFKPELQVAAKDIETFVIQHQERLKPFGLGSIAPYKTLKIWPGHLPENVFELIKKAKSAISQMFIESALGIVREVALDAIKLTTLDMAVREVSGTLKNSIRDHAIEAAGLTVKSTITMPIILPDQIRNPNEEVISDIDVVEKALEDAVEIAGWCTSWMVVDDLLEQKGYKNPFLPLMELFRMGLWPIGIVKNEFIVLIPGGRRIQLV